MPELPEVETIRRGLKPLVNQRITHIVVRRRDLRFPIPLHLEQTLKGRTLTRIDRQAKYLLFHFDADEVMLVHLGMSGTLTLHKKKPAQYRTHDHVIMESSEGWSLVFHDPRRFGCMMLTDKKSLSQHLLLAKLGPEPLTRSWNGAMLYQSLRKARSPIKTAIMDQQRVVGVGNIYACEALFRARIHPERIAQTLSRQETLALATAIKAVLRDAIKSGGSTLRDYVRSSGDSGYFQHHFTVYGKQKKPCTLCHNPIEMARQSGRSTFFCPVCQPEQAAGAG
jgi:formamidopyrimidine-DNA glycosylase